MGMSHAGVLPYWLLRFLGISELAGALGIILPALTRIKPVLTPLAALGFTTIQLLALGFRVARGELAQMAPINLTLLFPSSCCGVGSGSRRGFSLGRGKSKRAERV